MEGRRPQRNARAKPRRPAGRAAGATVCEVSRSQVPEGSQGLQQEKMSHREAPCEGRMRFDISTRGWCLWLPFENPPLLPPSRLPGDLARLVGWRLLQDGVLNKVSLVMERRARFLRTTGSGVTSNEPPDEASWAAKEGLQTIARSALTEIAGLFQELRQLLSTILLATPEERWSVPFAGSPTPALGGSGEHVMMLTDLLLSVARVSVVAAFALKTFVAARASSWALTSSSGAITESGSSSGRLGQLAMRRTASTRCCCSKPQPNI